jgi:hypothetical protein
MKNPRKQRVKQRLPLDAVLRLRSHPVSSQKGEKGYNRKKVKDHNRKIAEDEFFDENPDENH